MGNFLRLPVFREIVDTDILFHKQPSLIDIARRGKGFSDGVTQIEQEALFGRMAPWKVRAN